MPVTVNNNGPIQDYVHLDIHAELSFVFILLLVFVDFIVSHYILNSGH